MHARIPFRTPITGVNSLHIYFHQYLDALHLDASKDVVPLLLPPHPGNGVDHEKIDSLLTTITQQISTSPRPCLLSHSSTAALT